MLIRLSRILFWIAAAAAATALWGPVHLATPLTALAGIGVLLAYGLARLALLRARRAAVTTVPDSSPLLDETALRDVAARVDAAVAGSHGFEDALHAAAATLRAELGPREATVHRVVGISPPIAELVTLAPDGTEGVEHRVRLERPPLGLALARGSPVGRGAGPWAIPVDRGGDRAAVIELGPLALQAALGGLEALFEWVAARLTQWARADAPSEATLEGERRDILTPAGTPESVQVATDRQGCQREYEERSVTSDRLPVTPVPEQPTRPTAPAVLDAQALERLRELDPRGDNKLIERVLRAFESSAARLTPQLEAARASGDRGGVRHVAHTLKSSAASIGALELSQHCAAVEALIREDRPDDLEPPVGAMLAELDAVLLAVRSMLHRPA
jgi:HPt (histidine-containing phosphotransfer) domain-containing protein